MLGIQCYIFFGPPPSPGAAAITALVSYVVFAAIAQWLDRQREHATPSNQDAGAVLKAPHQNRYDF